MNNSRFNFTKTLEIFSSKMTKASVIGLFAVGLYGIHMSATKAEDLYLQGQFGFGMISDVDVTANGATNSREGDGFQNTFSVEGGMENLGAKQNIRAGLSYTNMDIALENSDVDQGATMIAANGYYFLENPNLNRGSWKPYIGAGIGMLDIDELGSETAIMFHAGVEREYNQDISIGGRYSYIMMGEPSGSINGVQHELSDTNMHLFSANVTYHIRGGL